MDDALFYRVLHFLLIGLKVSLITLLHIVFGTHSNDHLWAPEKTVDSSRAENSRRACCWKLNKRIISRYT